MMRTILAVVTIAALTAVIGFSVQSANAQSAALTTEQIERIRTNCTSTKSTLQQLHASDALLRVNRGQVYESMATKLMDPFNARLGNNRLDNKASSVVTASYRTGLDTFRADYKSYEETLSRAIRIDCVDKPELFYATIAEARVLRAKVHEDVIKLHRYIDDYRTAVSDFQLNFERLSE